MMTDEWINSLSLNVFECTKRMMVAGKQLRPKSSREYETASLHTPYRIIALMLNKIFDWVNGKFFKMSWIPLIYHVSMQGTIFNWLDIVANNLLSCINAAQGGSTERKSEFYMGSYLIDCILCIHQF